MNFRPGHCHHWSFSLSSLVVVVVVHSLTETPTQNGLFSHYYSLSCYTPELCNKNIFSVPALFHTSHLAPLANFTLLKLLW
uniref:Uncharacterized protein n=1 Tax=Moniliophthora roreri TaxID=221103 RepID=A0A0W0FDS2_MONRR